MRSLEEIANATPKEYLSHAPSNPVVVAARMKDEADKRFPKRGDNVQDANHSFLFVGPGSGLVVNELLGMEQSAKGVETSKRGIASAPEGVWTHTLWTLPWELAFGDRRFDIALINRYLKELLTPEEWSMTVREVKRVSKYSAII